MARVKAVQSPQVPALVLPPYVDSGSAVLLAHSYHSLGHCLRTNVFPGAPLEWKSLSKDSYIRHPQVPWPPDPHLWFGHKTDDLIRWTERNILTHKLNKTLTEVEKNGKKPK